MTWQGFVEVMLFLAMVIGVCLATFDLMFPTKNKSIPTADNEDNE